ncbi:MAG: helicase-related protein [Candidatus Woesearchaeota archaeon]|jgi:helicase
MINIEEKTDDPVINISLNTLNLNKQLLAFFNTKKSAEASAERIYSTLDKSTETPELIELANKIEKVLSAPTKQCKRLAKIIRRGVSFHHSGLHSEQRAIVEENFRAGKIKIICSTTTLGAGLDLPAFRVVIKDLKRFNGGWGMSNIPVLEYEQMAGRAGRPSYDNEGQAICIASSVEEQEEIWEQYINGEPEDILSKLAVEPVMRTYVLSLIATGYTKSTTSLTEFMSKTFYAHQYKDISALNIIIENILQKLEDWEFINIIDLENDEKEKKKSLFSSAKNFSKKKEKELKATKLGERVAELYLDPETAHYLLECMKKSASNQTQIVTPFALLHMICSTLELRPLNKVRKKDIELVNEKIVLEESNLLSEIPDSYSDEFDEFTNSIKTAIILEQWINETSEEILLEDMNITPGDLNSKLDRGDWLLYSSYDLSKIQGFRNVGKEILKLRERLKGGIKEELLPLVRLKGIGRVRARKMFNNKIRDIGDIKKIDISILGAIIGDKLALDVKKQVGQDLSEEKIKIRPNKRKGQISLHDFGE